MLKITTLWSLEDKHITTSPTQTPFLKPINIGTSSERVCRVHWGHHFGEPLCFALDLVNFPFIHLLSICSDTLGWSIGTKWPASRTYVLRHGTKFGKLGHKKRERERERERETLRKVRGPWLLSNPASAPSTTNGTVGDASYCFCPDHSRAWTHREFPVERERNQ